MTNLGVRHESEGMRLGSRGYKELNLQRAVLGGAQDRGDEAVGKDTSAMARGALGKGSLKLMAGFVLRCCPVSPPFQEALCTSNWGTCRPSRPVQGVHNRCDSQR